MLVRRRAKPADTGLKILDSIELQGNQFITLKDYSGINFMDSGVTFISADNYEENYSKPFIHFNLGGWLYVANIRYASSDKGISLTLGTADPQDSSIQAAYGISDGQISNKIKCIKSANKLYVFGYGSDGTTYQQASTTASTTAPEVKEQKTTIGMDTLQETDVSLDKIKMIFYGLTISDQTNRIVLGEYQPAKMGGHYGVYDSIDGIFYEIETIS